MNRRERRALVKNTKEGEVDKWGLLRNAKPISQILLTRFTNRLKAMKIDFTVIKDEVKTNANELADSIYEEELERLKNDLKAVRGDYKKLKYE